MLSLLEKSILTPLPSPPLPITRTILGIDEFTLVGISSEDRSKRFVATSHGGGSSDVSIRREYDNGAFFINEQTNEMYPFGSFTTPTVEELRELVSRILEGETSDIPATASTIRPPVPLTIRSGVDIANLQGRLQTSDRAMVQVASNFNCVENPSRYTTPHSGFLVDGAHRDRTQGPAAVFGTTSAYLYRCHFHGGGQDPSMGGQPVNLLLHAAEYYGTPVNGKLTLTGNERPVRTEGDVDGAAAKVCIGLHADCPILFGRSNSGQIVYNEPTVIHQPSKGPNPQERLEFPLVDHVLSSSINLHSYGVGNGEGGSPATDKQQQLMRSLLRAAYEGIYLAAIVRRRRTLYLTLIGGGSFGNPVPTIVEEILRAHDLWASHPASVLEKCVLCLYSRESEQQVRDAIAAAAMRK